jgi:hypothetical protein
MKNEKTEEERKKLRKREKRGTNEKNKNIIKTGEKGLGCSLVVEHLPSMFKTLSLIPSSVE